MILIKNFSKLPVPRIEPLTLGLQSLYTMGDPLIKNVRTTFINTAPSKSTFNIPPRVISKELNHFEGIASFIQDWAPGTMTGGA